MSKTPTKTDSAHQFRAREMTTPNKDQQEITKAVYSHITKVHGSLCDWVKMRDKGVRVFKVITSYKLHECLDGYYPSQLRPQTQTLLEIMESLKNIIDRLRILREQLKALALLQPNNEPAIATWPVSQISMTVIQIVDSLEKEYKLKEVIVENVAHCRDEKLLEVYITAWEHEAYFNIKSFAYLFAEAGLAGIP